MGIRGHSSVVSLEEMIRPSPISSRSTMAGTLTRQQKKNVRLVMFLILLACYHNSIRVRSFLLRAALVPPSLSPWRKLYDEGDSSSFLHVTGLTREAFDSLVMIVIPPGHSLRRRRRGRPWSLPPDGMLGLLLCYLGSQMTMKWLCLIFGITPSPCCRILKKILRMTVKRLRFHPLARISFPNGEQMQRFAEMISLHEPTIANVIGFMDGLGLATEMTDERLEQNAYYCGYDCDTMINNVLVFGPDGKVFFCALNYPGSWSDGTLTVRFFSHITERIGDYKICVDQGFPRSGDAYGILVGPIPERSARRLHSSVRDNLLRLSNVYTSLRQASEWGMRGLQGSFPRCKKRLPSDKNKRRRVIECIVLVHNFRTAVVGHNQITTVFAPEYERVININGYDRIRQYYLQPGDYETDDEAELMEENFGAEQDEVEF